MTNPSSVPSASQPTPLTVHVGEHVIMRKPHPCGSSEWIVTRVGTDIGLRCVGCDRRVMLARGEFNKRVKKIIRAVQPADSTGSQPAEGSQTLSPSAASPSAGYTGDTEP